MNGLLAESLRQPVAARGLRLDARQQRQRPAIAADQLQCQIEGR